MRDLSGSHSQLDALSCQRLLRNRLVDFALAHRPFKEPKLLEFCARAWRSNEDNGGLVSQLWVEGIYPPLPGTRTLESLSSDGFFDSSLLELLDNSEAFPSNRPLYSHQEKAIL